VRSPDGKRRKAPFSISRSARRRVLISAGKKNFSEKERCGTLEQSMWELRCVQAYIMQSLTLEYGYLRATIMAKVSEIIHAVSKHNTRDITRLCKASDRGQ